MPAKWKLTGLIVHPYNNTYSPYGVPANQIQGRFAYTGQIDLTGLGLYYYKARIYEPYLGRFLQTDPIGYADNMNLYAYVANDPLNATDPSGMEIVFHKDASLKFRIQIAKVIAKAILTDTADDILFVANSKEKVVLRESKLPHRMEYVRTGNVMFIDPTSGLMVDFNEIQSPALGVLHEFRHAAKDVENPVLAGMNSTTYDRQYDTAAERDVISNVETPAAIRWGEATRANHLGTPVRVACVTCTVEIDENQNEEDGQIE